MNNASPTPTASGTQSQIFGLRYLEEDAADILEIAGCQGLVAVDDQDSPEGLTIHLCGDGLDTSSF
jgi:hypothetical protein